MALGFVRGTDDAREGVLTIDPETPDNHWVRLVMALGFVRGKSGLVWGSGRHFEALINY
jgi:hypothetical protein